MIDNQLEAQLRENAEAIFGQEKELPAGHRERFEQRLKDFRAGREKVFTNKSLRSNAQTATTESGNHSNEIISWKAGLITTVAVAAAFAGFIFLLNPFVRERQNSELADVRNYYNMRLMEQAETTRQLIRQVDESHRGTLCANVELIENEPIPDIQIPDDEYIILMAGFYSTKIETLQNIQNLIKTTESTSN